MGPTNKKRLLLLCGASALALQVAAAPSVRLRRRRPRANDPGGARPGTVLLHRGHHDPDGRRHRAPDPVDPGRRLGGRAPRPRQPGPRLRAHQARAAAPARPERRPAVRHRRAPFLTTEGWKALDPEATRRESPGWRSRPCSWATSCAAGAARGRRRTPVGARRRPACSSCKARWHSRCWPRPRRSRTRRCSTCSSTATTATSPTAGSSTTRTVAAGRGGEGADGGKAAPTLGRRRLRRQLTPERPAARAVARRRMAARPTVGRRTAASVGGGDCWRRFLRRRRVGRRGAGSSGAGDGGASAEAARRRRRASDGGASAGDGSSFAADSRASRSGPSGGGAHKAGAADAGSAAPGGAPEKRADATPPDPSRAPGPPRPGPLRRAPRPRPRSVWSTPWASTIRPTRASGRRPYPQPRAGAAADRTSLGARARLADRPSFDPVGVPGELRRAERAALEQLGDGVDRLGWLGGQDLGRERLGLVLRFVAQPVGVGVVPPARSLSEAP